jgi:hypothetical protein
MGSPVLPRGASVLSAAEVANIAMKGLWVVCFFCVGFLLSAQEIVDVTLYFAPAVGGSPEDREFFDVTIPREIRSPHYLVIENPEEANFLVYITIGESGVPEFPSSLTMSLTASAAAAEFPLLELSWNYAAVEEMYTWQIGSILAPTVPEGSGEPPGFAGWRRREHWLFAGFRGGVSFTENYFQLTNGYNPGRSSGISFEGGLVAELRLFRYLSFQVEGDFLYESFESPGVVAEGGKRFVDTFSAMSLMFPVVVKASLGFGRFTLAPYAGLYYTLSLGDAERQSGVSGETESIAVKLPLPLGFTTGLDAGFIFGPGELFADLRYGKDFGATVMGDGEGPLHSRDRVSICFGYKYGF